MKQSLTRAKRVRISTVLSLVVLGAAITAVNAPRESVVRAQPKAFELVDATIEDVHALSLIHI